MEQVSFKFMATVTISSDFGAQENKICHCFHFSLSIYYEVMELEVTELNVMIFVFCHKGGAYAYLRLLIFLPAILIPACA